VLGFRSIKAKVLSKQRGVPLRPIMVDSTDVRSRTTIDLHAALPLQPSSRPESIVIKVECFLLDVLLLFPLLRVDNIFRKKIAGYAAFKYSCTCTIHGAPCFKMSDKEISKTGNIRITYI
jgi:hypothetical protein